MNTPSSRHLSHDFPAYKGLTLRELFIIVITTTMFSCLVFGVVGFMLGWVVAFVCAGFLIGFVMAVTLLPKPIARFKQGKPHGHLIKTITLTLVKFQLKKSPYCYHVGLWQRVKHIRGQHV